MMIILLLMLGSDNRVEKLQNAITEKVVVEINVKDDQFFRIWQTLENYRWEQEKLHWVILDSLTRATDPKRVVQLMGRMRGIDSVYTRKIFTLQDSLIKYVDNKKVQRFIIIRKKINMRLKTIIREIRSGAD